MKKIVLWYNKNRKLIFTTIIVLIILILLIPLIRYINSIIRTNESSTVNSVDTIIGQKDNINNNLNDTHLDTVESVVSGENLTQSQIGTLTIIDEFIALCNNKQIEEAYNLLSDECKEEMYPTVENFTNSYYNQIFGNSKKTVSIENWINNTYKISIIEDALSTGIYTTSNAIQDYITIVNDSEGNLKLNINSYINREEKNVTRQTDELNIELLRIDTYMEYQIYRFKVTNNTDNSIILDDKQISDSMYLEDENELKYEAYIHEITEEELTISPKQTKEIEIKFYNNYSSTGTITSINFSRIILNYNSFNTINEGKYNNYVSLKIDL